MPFDGNPNDHVVKPDISSVASFVAWLETMPADGKYNYFASADKCLLGQYFASHGGEYEIINNQACGYRVNGILVVDSYEHQLHRIASTEPYTFGAALSRARALLAEGK